MATNKLANLKSQLLTSGLSGKDQPLFQIINQLIQYLQDLGIDVADIASSNSSGGSGITSLNTDVVATGPGAAVATIQPNVVSYGKIQNVTGLRLLGNPEVASGLVAEIPLGENLEFLDGVLEITVPDSGGATGLSHKLLSATHTDTLPADAVTGDIIYAGPGSVFAGTYVNGIIISPLDFALSPGIYCALYLGFDGGAGIVGPIGGAISVDWGALVAPTVPDTWLTWDLIDAYITANPVISEIGIYGSMAVSIPGSGIYLAIYAYPFTLITPPNPQPDYSLGTWRRKEIGADGQVLTIVDGIPEWEDLPPIPAEPSYPWTDITFNAGDFTATGGTTPTWTVASGDVERWQRQQFPGTAGVGNNVRIALYVRATTVGGTGPTQLRITLPFNIVGRFAQFISIQEAGAATTNVFIEYDDAVSTTTLYINKIGGGAFDTTAAGTFLAFEISAVLAP